MKLPRRRRRKSSKSDSGTECVRVWNTQPAGALPRHIGIIMDGNGRWAQPPAAFPRTAPGHKAGADTFGKIAKMLPGRSASPYLTIYAFSTENWKRPADEVGGADGYFCAGTWDEMFQHREEDARRAGFLGERGPLSDDIREMMARAEAESAKNAAITINIALNYGGRDEIVHAALARLRADALPGSFLPTKSTKRRLPARSTPPASPTPT